MLLCLWGTHVCIFDHFHDVHSVVFSVGQALANEILGLCRYGRLIRKLDFGGLQNNVFFKDSGLRLIVTEWLEKSSIIENLVKSLTGQNYLFAVKTLVENDTE